MLLTKGILKSPVGWEDAPGGRNCATHPGACFRIPWTGQGPWGHKDELDTVEATEHSRG